MSVYFRSTLIFAFASLLFSVFCQPNAASDWTRFRGPNGTGVSPDEKAVPTQWSAEKNLK
jgi:hypothetical protein